VLISRNKQWKCVAARNVRERPLIFLASLNLQRNKSWLQLITYSKLIKEFVCVNEHTVPSLIRGNYFVKDVRRFLWKLLLLYRNVEVEAVVVLKKWRMRKLNPVLNNCKWYTAYLLLWKLPLRRLGWPDVPFLTGLYLFSATDPIVPRKCKRDAKVPIFESASHFYFSF
jgi:hypothetical protein